ncbi:ATP-binding cassette domain-containing protein [Streptomyces sp. NPDC057638]|uniref:ATP-binding cassette domain-containing protein n=1 Tax=Streptomyces sp. NPDC057638 TaxID=3346190 RepID=UPI0036A5CC44
MLQAIGLTSAPRREHPPAVHHVTLEALPGRFTVLLGPPGAGKSTALRLMLGLEPGRGVTFFRGNLLHRIARPAREVGALLGDVPGHPGRSCRGQLRMLCAATGVPTRRADELLAAVGLADLAAQPLGTLPLALDRRLGLASALLGDPQTLLLDDPARGLRAEEGEELYVRVRAHVERGGTVLCALQCPKEAARVADRVVSLQEGTVIADQEVAEFTRTRFQPRVAVRTPYALRLADLLHREARSARRSVEAVTESGGLLSVYGSSCAEVGEVAFRHGVLVHRLADERGASAATGDVPVPTAVSVPLTREKPAGERWPDADSPESPGTAAVPGQHGRDIRAGGSGAELVEAAETAAGPAFDETSEALESEGELEVVEAVDSTPLTAPVHPLRYEVLRMTGTRTAALVGGAALLFSLIVCVLLARSRATPLPVALAAWPGYLPLPPAALGAGVIGALAFGEERSHPALAVARGAVPRRLALLLAKLTVTAAASLLIALVVVAVDAQALRLLYGGEALPEPGERAGPLLAWCALCVGCGWAGLLGAGVFRVTAAGVAAVLVVPVVVAPLVEKAIVVPSVRSAAGFIGRIQELAWVGPPRQLGGVLTFCLRSLAQPVGVALMVSLSVLICAYVFTGRRWETG